MARWFLLLCVLASCGRFGFDDTPANQVFCWGDNARGQLGQGFATRSLVPGAVDFP